MWAPFYIAWNRLGLLKNSRPKNVRQKSRQDPLQTIFSGCLDIFYPSNSDCFGEPDFFNSHACLQQLAESARLGRPVEDAKNCEKDLRPEPADSGLYSSRATTIRERIRRPRRNVDSNHEDCGSFVRNHLSGQWARLTRSKHSNTADTLPPQNKRSPRYKTESSLTSDIKMTFLATHAVAADTVIATGLDDITIKATDGRISHRYERFTDTWILRDGRWQCVAEQLTLGPA